MFLVQLQRFAHLLLPLRRWCLGLALLGTIGAGYALTEVSSNPSTFLRLSILFTLWMLMTFAFIKLFQEIPSPVLPGLRWWERLRQRLHLWAYQLLAISVVVVGVSLLSLTVKLWLL